MIIKDTFFTLAPINWFLRITALSKIYREGIEVQTFGAITKTTIYILVLTSVNLLLLYIKLDKIANTNIQDGFVNFYNIIQIYYWFSYFIYITDLYFVQKYGGVALIKHIKTFDAMDGTLGKADCDEIRKTIVTSIALSIGVFLFVTFFDYFSWAFVEDWKEPSLYAIDYVYWFLNILTILDGISQIIQVEFRLKVIQRLLKASSLFGSAKLMSLL